jgi:hypothetical protein
MVRVHPAHGGEFDIEMVRQKKEDQHEWDGPQGLPDHADFQEESRQDGQVKGDEDKVPVLQLFGHATAFKIG